MSYRLPDGKVTDDANEYFTAWRKLYEFMENFLGDGWKVIGYDPGILFGKDLGRGLDLPAWFCLKIKQEFDQKHQQEDVDGKI